MLVDRDDIKMLSGLKVRLRRRIRRKPAMDFRSSDTGGSQEFVDYQPFTPGENIRHMDWNRYMRDSTLYTRQYENLERPEISVVCDLSASVAAGGNVQAVKRLTAAICFCLLNQGMNVKLYANEQWMRCTGRSGWQRIHQDIARLSEHQAKVLALRTLAAALSDHVIILSDLIVSEGYDHFKRNSNQGRRNSYFIAVSSHFDRNPDLDGNLRLQDAQNGRLLPCYIDTATIARYQHCRAEYFGRIQAHCKRMNWQYNEVDADVDLRNQMYTLAPHGTLYL